MVVRKRLTRSWRWVVWWVSAVVIGAITLGHYRRALDPETEWRIIGETVAAQRWNDAERLLTRWLRRFPEDGNAWIRLGALLYETNRPDAALAAFRRVNESDAAWPIAQTWTGDIARRTGKLAEAECAFWAAARREARAIEPRSGLVALFMVQQRPELVRVVLWDLYYLTREVRHLAALTSLAVFGIDDVDPLEPLLKSFLCKSPADVWLRRACGLTLLRQGHPAEALPYLEDVTLLEGDLEGRFALAECHIALNHAFDLDALLGPLSADPRAQAQRWALLAEEAESRANAEQSLTNWQRAVTADPSNRVNQYRLGQALIRAGARDAARVHLERAAAIGRRQRHLRMLLSQIGPQHEKDALMYETIGALCLESGLTTEARAWYEEAIRIDPTRTTAQAALSHLTGPRVHESLPAVPPRRPISTAPTVVAHVASSSQSGPRFEDVAVRAGVTYRYMSGATADLFIADTMGGGVGLIDYDNDGWLDIYLVNGCPLPVDPQHPPAPNRLYHNLRNGHFEDVTERAGVGGRGYGMGCAVGDFDGDGNDDLFITGFRDTLLYRNRGNGTFEDVTKRAGVYSSRWTTAAGFADLDGDHDVDLVVIAYVDADPGRPIHCSDQTGRQIHCTPGYYRAQSNHLFRNNGNGTFTDVAREAGLASVEAPGLGLAIADFDDDGRLDLFVANDAVPNALFHNLGQLRFEETGVVAGLAYSGDGHATASMGVIADDLDGDGLIDIFHTNLVTEASTLARNLGGGRFADVTERVGLVAPSRSVTGFGTVALDADNDGRLDLFAANGHVDDMPWQNRPMGQLPHFYRSVAPGRFERPAPATTGVYFTQPVVGRGAAVGDLDNDGRLDIVVVHREGPVAILRNITTAGRSLGLRLHGKAPATMPVGARVTCHLAGRTLVRWVTSGTGYLSAHDSRIWFGLGTSSSVDTLEVHWPSGAEQKWFGIAADQIVEIQEGRDLVTHTSFSPR